MYATFRRSDSIGEMRVIQLTRDTFMRLKAVTIERNQNQQYKTPRVLRNPALLAFLFKCQLDWVKFSQAIILYECNVVMLIVQHA